MTVQLGVGAEFARYRLDAEIGRGGTGTVYRATDLDLHRVVALKILDPRTGFSQEIAETLALEADLLPKLRHPNVIPVYEAGELDGLLYIAMPLIDGSDLAALIRKEGKLALKRTSAIIDQVAAGLDAAHVAGLVHRDVKPQNVMVFTASGTEHVQLTDFGLMMDLTGTGHFSPSGYFLGSLHYAAPEQIKGGAIDGRTDVYGLGCLLYECLAGQVPFPRRSGFEVLWAQVNEAPPKVSSSYPEIPEEVDRIIHKAAAKQLEDRFLTAGEVAAALRQVAGRGSGDQLLVSSGSRSQKALWSSAPRARNPALDIANKVPHAIPTRQRSRSASGVAAVVALSLVTAVALAREPSAPVETRVSDDVAERAHGVTSSGESILDSNFATDKGSDRGSHPTEVNVATAIDGEVGGPLERLPVPRVPLGAPEAHGESATSAATGSGPLPPLIAYHDYNDIYVVRPNGTGRTNLTDSPLSEFDPEWSPDGTRIVYMSRLHGGLGPDTGDLYVVDAHGNGVTRLTTDPNIEGQPAWSPDGTKIAFSELIPTEQEPEQERRGWILMITVMNADGSRTKQTLVEGSSPDWSPDGRWISYVDPDGVIRIMRSDGSDNKPITDPIDGSVSPPSWSPNGRYIAFFLYQSNAAKPVALSLVDLLSGRLKRVGTIQRMNSYEQLDWTPDGRKVLFERYGDFYIMALDGTKPRLLVDNPDGSRLSSDPVWRSNSYI